METRSAMAYWQNGKVYLHGSTQSVARTVDPLANWLGIDASNIVLISEYCGGGFGSKGAGAVSMAIPAMLSKKADAFLRLPVQRGKFTGQRESQCIERGQRVPRRVDLISFQIARGFCQIAAPQKDGRAVKQGNA